MESMKIKVNSGIKRIAIENEKEEVVSVLILDTNDSTIVERFATLMERIEQIYADCQKAVKEENISDDDVLTIEQAKRLAAINKTAINELIKETEKMFGDRLIRDAFKDNYTLNKDFVPDILTLKDFYQQLIPVITSVYQHKTTAKYGVEKRGKHTKTKEELLAELKGEKVNE